MSYFNRLTDIVTCNLSEILARENNPQTAIKAIIAEMEEGLAGAQRAVNTARNSEERIRKELDEIRVQADRLNGEARTAVAAGKENDARLALLRKQESEDVIAGLEQQHQAANATLEHLSTTQRALEARLADARRKLQQLESGTEGPADSRATTTRTVGPTAASDPRARRIEEELEALKRELGNPT